MKLCLDFFILSGGKDLNNQPVHAIPLRHVHTCQSAAELRRKSQVIFLNRNTELQKKLNTTESIVNLCESFWVVGLGILGFRTNGGDKKC